MKTLAAALAFSVLLGAPALAQQSSNESTSMPVPAAPPAKAGANAPAVNPFWVVDPAIKELGTEVGEQFSACLAAVDYLQADLASTQRRVKKHGEQIPGDQADLLAMKMKRFAQKKKVCTDQSMEIGGHFTMAMRYLSNVEPKNNHGIPARRERILALREKFNAALKRLEAAGSGKAAAAGKAAESDEGSEQ